MILIMNMIILSKRRKLVEEKSRDKYNIEYKKIFMIPLVIVLCGYSLCGIYNAAKPLTERNILVENLIDYGRQFENKKFIISENVFSLTIVSGFKSKINLPEEISNA